MKNLVSIEGIEKCIYLIRGQKVMFDRDLSELYGVETRVLVQAVRRNSDRFPEDFMFQLTWDEIEKMKIASRSQIVILKRGSNIKHLPYVFTEQGIAMLSSILRSKRAVQVNIEIMRAFVRLRQMLISHKDLSRKLNELEKQYDGQFKIVFEAINQLMTPPPIKKRRIGFNLK